MVTSPPDVTYACEPPPGLARVDVVLPCLDEAQALPWVLARIPASYRAIVVDNGSRDGSAQIAADLGATVVVATQRGFGSACAAGLAAATAPVVAFMDADLVLGRRRPTRRGAWPWHLRLANAELCRRLHRRTGVRLHDLGPMRAARREALVRLGLVDRRSGYPLEMVVGAADAGWRVAEVDVAYAPRTGRSKVTGTPLGAARAVRDMSVVLRSDRPRSAGRRPGEAPVPLDDGAEPSRQAPDPRSRR